MFVRSGATWSQQASFKASNSGIEDWYGTLAVGARSGGGGAGSVYLFNY